MGFLDEEGIDGDEYLKELKEERNMTFDEIEGLNLEKCIEHLKTEHKYE